MYDVDHDGRLSIDDAKEILKMMVNLVYRNGIFE